MILNRIIICPTNIENFTATGIEESVQNFLSFPTSPRRRKRRHPSPYGEGDREFSTIGRLLGVRCDARKKKKTLLIKKSTFEKQIFQQIFSG
jgi:hypothetical protein